MSRLVTTSLLALALVFFGCENDDPPSGDGGVGKKEGEDCQRTSNCATSLVCSGEGKCARPGQPGTGDKGDGCASSGDCQVEYICASFGKCNEPGNGGEGDRCRGNEDCTKDLLCSALLKCATPGSPGTKGKDEACSSPEDCALGLVCLEQKCTPLEFWPGATCTPDNGPYRAYFEVPRTGKPLSEWYRLPFPNDIRIVNGKVDVSAHPNPQINLPANYGDVVGNFLKQINQDVDGFGLNTAVLLRMSKTMDLDTVTVSGQNPTVQFVDIDKSSPRFGQGVSLFMFASTGQGKYICSNWIGVRPGIGSPLSPNTTYAVLLRKGIKDNQGAAAQQDDDFAPMLASAGPADADLKAAWDKYQPLRDYIADQQIDGSTILSAAVFTTMDPRRKMANVRDAVRSASRPAAKIENVVLCDGATTSPCADPKEAARACPSSPDSAFHELHGIYKTAVLQSGTKPYLTPADGGDIKYDAQGLPIVQGTEDSCFALTIPKGATMPAEGWPLLIYAHGTGGYYRSFIDNGTAAALADAKDKNQVTLANMAVISTDGAMHGPRRGSDGDPAELFFNLRNPVAARDNTYQGVADLFELMRLVESVDLDNAASPTGEAIKFDLTKIYFLGHSQGTIVGVPFVAYEPQVKAVVLSGAGGYLLGSLLFKTKPVNVSAGIKFVLTENDVGSTHPLLNLVQLYFEEIDTINYGRAVMAAPVTGVESKHTFLSYGVADSFTPQVTIEALGRVMGLKIIDQPAALCGDGVCSGDEDCNSCAKDCPTDSCGPVKWPFATDTAPAMNNVNTPSGQRTAAICPYVSDGSYDAHQVLFQNPAARQQSVHFLGSAAKDAAPTIPAQ
ncbi:MAG: hypothetical protein KC503_30895 [Myxococcales bacterium]|nr:hypothetical protein [Myxococcales bacterium]